MSDAALIGALAVSVSTRLRSAAPDLEVTAIPQYVTLEVQDRVHRVTDEVSIVDPVRVIA